MNRLFPIKLVCRWLAAFGAKETEWPKYAGTAQMLADDAGTIGSLLDEWDRESERERGGELATALPRRKNNASLDRFLSQFVARITRASEVVASALANTSLLGLRIVSRFDRSGIAFASLRNPTWTRKSIDFAFGSRRSEFLATHIKTGPTDWHDMRAVLEAIAAGKTSPNEVVSTVRSELPSEWTDSMARRM